VLENQPLSGLWSFAMRGFSRQAICVTPMVVLGVLCALVGCSKAQEALSDQERAHTVRSALRAYADGVSTMAAEQEHWVEKYKKATERKDFDSLRNTLLESVLPTLDKTIKSLEAVPAETDSLRKIHGSLVKAYQRLAEDLQAFATGLNAENYNDHRKTLATRLTRFHRDQRVYREKIQDYYESVGVTLVASP